MERKDFLRCLGLEGGSITSIVTGGKRRLHTVYEDGTERIDEFDQHTHETLLRKIKKKSSIREAKWEYEIGEEPVHSTNDTLLQQTSKAPIFLRKDTLKEFQWRIRNLPYSSDVFVLTVEDNQIVVRTTIKKYFKRISIPDLARLSCPLESPNLKWLFKNNTLLITYQKPSRYVQLQDAMMMEFTRLNMKKPKDGDLECNVQ